MQLTVSSLGRDSPWPGISLVQQPPLTDITMRVFTAGGVPEKVGQRMCQAAKATIRAVRSLAVRGLSTKRAL